MDGENCTVYNDGYIHARSIDGNSYPWQSKVKYIIQNWCYLIVNNFNNIVHFYKNYLNK